jgi:hypothetical protein
MRPLTIHICIILFLAILGGLFFTLETLSTPEGGWLIKKYTFTKLYWLAFFTYSLVSTIIVLVVGLFFSVKKISFSKKAVILSHLIPAGLLWVVINFGVHDMIQNIWKNVNQHFQPKPEAIKIEATELKRPPTPPSPPLKSLPYTPSGGPIEPDKQPKE